MAIYPVQYNWLGGSCGLQVSNICFGTLTFGQSEKTMPGNTNEGDSHLLLDRFAELGGNFIDTSNSYTEGKAEQVVGSWLQKQERDRYIVATKCRLEKSQTDPNRTSLSRKNIIRCLEESLSRLQTDYIDLYQSHCWDDGVPLKETLHTFNDLVRCGKVRYVGASNVTGWQLQKIVDYNHFMGFDRLAAVQQHYNLLCRQSEYEVVDVCRNEGVGFLPWSPLKGGLLTGKVKRDTPLDETSRLAWAAGHKSRQGSACPDTTQYQSDDGFCKLIATLESIAKTHDRTVAQVALRWLLQKDFVTSVVMGAKTIEQLESNMGSSTGWTLYESEMTSLDDVTSYHIPYPYELVTRYNKNRKRKTSFY